MGYMHRTVPVLLLLPFLSGCYTVIRHQPVEQSVGYYSDCLQCHDNGVEDYYVEEIYHLSADSYSRYAGENHYRYFHDSPWWWYYSYDEDEVAGEEDDSPVTRILRRHQNFNSTAVIQLGENVIRLSSSDEQDEGDQEEEEDKPRQKKLKRRKR
ncbi:MAG: hypothetical protein ISR91_00330 [Candidatus Delongbacteria bacterium]|nr:hypothetical protein [Candidatus Delongbacteria bacterium]